MSETAGKPTGTHSPKRLLGTMLRSARKRQKLSQAKLASTMGVGGPALSQFENGQRLPSVGQLANLAELLHIDLEKLILALAWEQVYVEKESEFPGARPDIKRHLLDAIEERVNAIQRDEPATKRALAGMLTLRDWPAGFEVRNVLVGDRRELPPNNYADVLALSASTGDLSYFGDLRLDKVRIRSDKIVKIADRQTLREKLNADILVVGSPAANLAARVVNGTACHRFHVEREVRKRQDEIESELEGIAYDGDELEAYVTPSTERNKKRIQALKYLLYAFAKPGFVCPTSYPNEKRGFARNSRIDFGVVTICNNPWSDSGIAILAAGIGGPGTAAALKLLATAGVFDDHPLGGVFKVRIATEAPWENRYDLLKPVWDSNPYSLDKFKADAVELGRDDTHDSLDDTEAASLMDLMERLESRA